MCLFVYFGHMSSMFKFLKPALVAQSDVLLSGGQEGAGLIPAKSSDILS